MCGMVPFGEEAEDPYEIYEEIIKKELTYPNYLKDKKAKKLMDQLLNKVPEIRLGGSYATLKANAWFENFDKHWDTLKLTYPAKFYRMWKYYLLSCAGSFRARKVQLWQIVLSKHGVPGGYQAIR